LGQSLYSLVQAEPSASGWMSGGGGGGSDLGWWWGVGGRTLGSGGRRSDLEGGGRPCGRADYPGKWLSVSAGISYLTYQRCTSGRKLSIEEKTETTVRNEMIMTM